MIQISKSKFLLLKPQAIDSLKTDLIPLATVITPNVYEAGLLAGCEIKTISDAKDAAKKITRQRSQNESSDRPTCDDAMLEFVDSTV